MREMSNAKRYMKLAIISDAKGLTILCSISRQDFTWKACTQEELSCFEGMMVRSTVFSH